MNHVRKSIALTVSSAIAVTAPLGALAGLAEAGGGDHGGGRHRDCRGIKHLTVPGAEHIEAACLEDGRHSRLIKKLPLADDTSLPLAHSHGETTSVGLSHGNN